MRKLLYALVLLPLLIGAQDYQEPLVLQNVMLTVQPDKVKAFEAGIAAHNKKYHGEGAFQALVYTINSGKNAGKYMWNMGPLPWSAMDKRPSEDNGHDADWDTNVAPYLTSDVDVNYWKGHMEYSDFSKDFTLKNLSVFLIDVKPTKGMDFMNKVIKKVDKVYSEKMPEQRRGLYSNELANMDGLDFAWVDFFGSMAWMGKEDKFPQYFEEVHGAGSFKTFLEDVGNIIDGQRTELWSFRKDLSGVSGDIEAVTGQ